MSRLLDSLPRLATAAALVVAALAPSSARANIIFSITAPTSVNAGSTGNTLEIRLSSTAGSPAVTIGGFTFGITSTQPGVTFTSATTSTAATYLFDSNSLLGPNIDDGPGTSMTGGDVAALGGTTVNGGDPPYGLALVFFDVDNSATGTIDFSFVTVPQQNTLSTPVPTTNIPISTFSGATTTIVPLSAVPEPSIPALASVVLIAAAGRRLWRRRSPVAS